MSETWYVFKLEELDTISFECPNCKSVITFAAEGEIVGLPERMCPACNKLIPDAGGLLTIYRQFSTHFSGITDCRSGNSSCTGRCRGYSCETVQRPHEHRSGWLRNGNKALPKPTVELNR
ncbi:MAG: hypothetical protein ACLQU1_03380 [Bryobacteraceae bacterium]